MWHINSPISFTMMYYLLKESLAFVTHCTYSKSPHNPIYMSFCGENRTLRGILCNVIPAVYGSLGEISSLLVNVRLGTTRRRIKVLFVPAESKNLEELKCDWQLFPTFYVLSWRPVIPQNTFVEYQNY